MKVREGKVEGERRGREVPRPSVVLVWPRAGQTTDVHKVDCDDGLKAIARRRRRRRKREGE